MVLCQSILSFYALAIKKMIKLFPFNDPVLRNLKLIKFDHNLYFTKADFRLSMLELL